jgi:hypothetical protein
MRAAVLNGTTSTAPFLFYFYVNDSFLHSQNFSPPVPNFNRPAVISTSTQSCAPGSTNSFSAFKTSSGNIYGIPHNVFADIFVSLSGSWYQLQSQ